jgi:regulatory protein
VPLGKPPKKVDREALVHYASMLLAQRAISTGDLRQKLRQKALFPEDVEFVINQLTEYGALNDARYAEAYATARKDNQGFGQARVLRDLNRKRIPGDLARQAVSATYSEVDEIAMISDYLARKFRGKNLKEYLSEPKHLASAFRRLRTAGFSSNNCMKVLRGYSSAAEHLQDEPDPADEE